MNMTRLLVGVKSENVKLKPGGDVHVCVVETPLVVCQIQSNGHVKAYHMDPDIYPTLHFLPQCSFLWRFPEILDGSRGGRTDRFVYHLPMYLLALLGLHIKTRVREKVVQRWSLRIPRI